MIRGTPKEISDIIISGTRSQFFGIIISASPKEIFWYHNIG